MGKSTARFTPFARGRIVGKAEEGASRSKIRKEVRKKDGSRAALQAIDRVLNHAQAGRTQLWVVSYKTLHETLRDVL